jgi:hypothetical protein
MSQAAEFFNVAIKDAEALLQHFDAIERRAPEDGEVLKRAGLVMAVTAWETYVEDRLQEDVEIRLQAIAGSGVGNFMRRKLEEELKRFHNPDTEKTRRVFREFLDVDVTSGWKWDNYQPGDAKKALDRFLSLRGDVVHRSKEIGAAHPVKRDTLEKVIRFLKGLVAATDRFLDEVRSGSSS